MGLTRSQQMSRIRDRDSRPERVLRRLLWSRGHRYRLQFRTPAGRADIALPSRQVAIFIDGCFWHGCPLHYVRPRGRAEFWASKLAQNVDRDIRQTKQLEDSGWLAIRLWEHEILEDPFGSVDVIEKVLSGPCRRPRRVWRVRSARLVDETNDLEERELVEIRGLISPRHHLRKRTTTKWNESPLAESAVARRVTHAHTNVRVRQ